MIARKALRSKARSEQGVAEIAVAVRGMFRNNAISPR